MMEVSWDDAAAYCNWLCKQEGIAKDEWCYEQRTEKGEYKTAANHFTAGRVIDCRNRGGMGIRVSGLGHRQAFGFGERKELLGKYCWFDSDVRVKSHPAGQLKSNDLGLFDMHGNAWERCDDRTNQYGGVAPAPRLPRRQFHFTRRFTARRRSLAQTTGPAARNGLGLRLARVAGPLQGQVRAREAAWSGGRRAKPERSGVERRRSRSAAERSEGGARRAVAEGGGRDNGGPGAPPLARPAGRCSSFAAPSSLFDFASSPRVDILLLGLPANLFGRSSHDDHHQRPPTSTASSSPKSLCFG